MFTRTDRLKVKDLFRTMGIKMQALDSNRHPQTYSTPTVSRCTNM